MAVMVLLRGLAVLSRQAIPTSSAIFECSGAIGEEERLQFRVEEPEDGITYRLIIGDFAPDESVGKEFAGQIWWRPEKYFESSRGSVPVHLESRRVDTADVWQRRMTLTVAAIPTKLGEGRYEAMLESLRAVSVGLVFDLLSKSSIFLGSRANEGISTRPASSELGFLSHLWGRISDALREIASQPQLRITSTRIVEVPLRTAMVGRDELNALVRKGFIPGRTLYSHGINVRRYLREESNDTPEHHTIAALIQLLYFRVRDCERRALAQAQLLRSERPMRDFRIDGQNLYLDADVPKLERLQNAIAEAQTIEEQMRLAMASPLLRGIAPRIGNFNTPVFNHVVSYRRFRDETLGYFHSSVAILAEGVEERLKATHRMYEQWIFLQVLASLREVGLSATSQSALLSQSAHQRFTIDFERGTQVLFLAQDGRSLRVRYEPWVLPKTLAEARNESVYKGRKGEVPWSPDLLIEVFSAGRPSARQPEYAVVIDAKYSRTISGEQQNGVRKYDEIRGIEDGRPVVKQVWIAHPGDAGARPWDDAVTWTRTGPDRPVSENVYGTFCASPPDDVGSEGIQEPNEDVVDFIRSLCLYLNLIPPDSAS
jgi:hypothetical protein